MYVEQIEDEKTRKRLGSPRGLVLKMVISLTKGQIMMDMGEPKVGKGILVKVYPIVLLNGL